MPELAAFIRRGLDGDAERVAAEVTAWRTQFSGIHFTTDSDHRPASRGTFSAPE
jgi:hypothetical protein